MVSGDTAGMAVQTAQKGSPSPADKMLIRAWLHSKSDNTRRAYERVALALLAHAGKPLADVTLPDLQNWSDSLKASEKQCQQAILCRWMRSGPGWSVGGG